MSNDLKYWGDNSGTGMGDSGGGIQSTASTLGAVGAATGNPYLAVGGAVAGGLAGMMAGNQDRAAAEANAAKAREIIGAVQVPELKQWLLQQYSSAGQFTPEMMNALSLDPSAQGAISTNPLERQKLVSQIDRLISQSKSGNTPEDQAAYDLATRNSLGANNSMQQSIVQNMQQRGAGGSGVELAARLSGEQQNADALQKAHLEEASKQNALRLTALTASAGQLSNLRGADYQQALNLANANDRTRDMKYQDAQGVRNANNETVNGAQKFNLANRQRIADANVDVNNKQQQYNTSTLPQAQYNMDMNKAQAQAGSYNNAATQQYQQAGQTAGMWSGIGQGVGTILAANSKPATAEIDPLTGKPKV